MNVGLLVRNKNFALLWFSQMISQAGNRMFQLAVAWWILQNSVSSQGLRLAVFMVLAAIPAIVLVRLIGRVIDSSPSKKVLLTSDFSGLIVAILLLLSMLAQPPSFILICIGGLLFSVCSSFIEPTLSRAVVQLVDPEDIDDAVAFNSSTVTIASFFGAICGAMLIDVLGVVGIVMINGVSYLVSSVCDYLIDFKEEKIQAQADISAEQSTDAASSSETHPLKSTDVFAEIPLVKKVLYAFALCNFFGTPVLIILPLYTQRILGGTAKTLALLESMVWLGLLLGTFGAKYLGLKDKVILFVGFCLVAFGFFGGLPVFNISIFFYAICLVGFGASLGALNVRIVTFFQQVVPFEVKGKFFSLLQALVGSGVPISFLFFGALSDYVEPNYICLIQGLGLFFVALYFLIYMAPQESEFRKYLELSKVKGELQ